MSSDEGFVAACDDSPVQLLVPVKNEGRRFAFVIILFTEFSRYFYWLMKQWGVQSFGMID